MKVMSEPNHILTALATLARLSSEEQDYGKIVVMARQQMDALKAEVERLRKVRDAAAAILRYSDEGAADGYSEWDACYDAMRTAVAEADHE